MTTACAWAETNVYQPVWAASLSNFFVRSKPTETTSRHRAQAATRPHLYLVQWPQPS